MKKLLQVLLGLCFMVMVVGCASNEPTPQEPDKEETQSQETQENEEQTTNEKALVLYFSWSGNTKALAEDIQEQADADIFEIVPQDAYTSNYNTLLDVAQDEKASNARPAISSSITNFDEYDTIFVGYPNWWGDMPMIMYTLFDQYDFSGKTIVPFVTSGGSGFSSTLNTIKELEPQATLLDGLSIDGDDASNASDDVKAWLQELHLLGE